MWYDASNPQHEKQMLIVYETLANLDVKDKTVITLFNKQDARMDSEPLHDFKGRPYAADLSEKMEPG